MAKVKIIKEIPNKVKVVKELSNESLESEIEESDTERFSNFIPSNFGGRIDSSLGTEISAVAPLEDELPSRPIIRQPIEQGPTPSGAALYEIGRGLGGNAPVYRSAESPRSLNLGTPRVGSDFSLNHSHGSLAEDHAAQLTRERLSDGNEDLTKKYDSDNQGSGGKRHTYQV